MGEVPRDFSLNLYDFLEKKVNFQFNNLFKILKELENCCC